MSVIRFCKTNEEYYGDNVYDISRPNIFGNPFTHLKKTSSSFNLVKVKTRDNAIDLYSKYFDKMYECDDEFKSEFDKMFKQYEEGRDIYLGCYCKPDERCHADIIEQKLIQFSMKKKLSRIKEKKMDYPPKL